MRKTWKCPKCDSPRVGYLEHASDETQGNADTRTVGYARGAALLGLQTYVRHGEMEAFVCTDCGYFEEYVKNPEAVRWNDLEGFRWCRPEFATG